MNRLLILGLAACTLLGASAKSSKKDPVLMTVDGVPVTVSEFEYLYHKNSDQQMQQQTLDEYLDMFVVYKLKVAEARHARVDTVNGFQQEFLGYRAELARPYLTDSVMYKQLERQAYERMTKEVDIDHLMVNLNDRQLIDSIRNAIVNGGADFLAMAAAHTTDPSFSRNQGRYGWTRANTYPAEFEDIVFDTPEGEVSQVATTQFGHHLVRVNAIRPTVGEVHARHILVSFPDGTGQSAEGREAAKHTIDSIHSLLMAGGDFDDIARRLSSCPSKAQGGDLGWFGPGRMVPEFEVATYALPDGGISEPFATRFGYHIVQRLESRGIPSFEESRQTIEQAMQRDGRAMRPVKAKADAIIAEYGGRVLPEGLNSINDAIDHYMGDFRGAVDGLLSDNTPMLQIGDSIITVAEFMSPVPTFAPDANVKELMPQVAQERLQQAALDYESHRLEQKYPEFRNLVNEYRDGMMLFEVSNREVWGRPANDPEGLEQYFQANRDKYATWDAPRFKGYIIYATTDSLMQEVRTFLDTNKPVAAEVGAKLKEAFPRNIKIERVVLPKGQNPIVDAEAFGGEPVDQSADRRWKAYTIYLGHLIDQPEEAADVRGAVSADYQTELEKAWVEQLRQRYPVEIDRKVLKKVK